jgi:Carboxypeptidase regulatory-like domain
MSQFSRSVFSLIGLFIFLLVSSSASHAQVVSGSISGTVVDASGAAITGAFVDIKATDTGATSHAFTSDTGYFRFVLLPIGNYDVTVSKDGFRKTSLSSLKVSANQEYAIGTINLEVGPQTAIVEVTAPPPLVEATQAQVTTDITGPELATYSGTGENQGLDMMTLTIPGIVNSRDNNFANTNGVGFSVNGIRGRSNDQQIDGQNNNDNSVTGPGLFVSNVDFVEEYQITTSNFGPEYGRNSGSVVNINTKSGTNNWHGTISGVETNSVLTTLNNIEKQFNGLTKPTRFNNEFTGGTIGGPLVKDKLFIFGGLDDQINSSNGVFSTGLLVPTPAGINQLASCFPDSTSVTALQAFGPYAIGAGNPTPAGTPTTRYYDNAPVNNTTDPNNGNAPACGYQLNGIQRTLPNGFHEWDWITRVDWQINSKNSIYGRYLFQKQNFFNAFGVGAVGYPVNVPSLTNYVLGQWTHTFSSTQVNEFRFGYSHANVQFGGNTIGTVPPQTDIGEAITSIGFTDSSLSGYGPSNVFPQGRVVKTYQVQDNFDFTKGHHQLKVGVNFTAQHSPNVFLPNYNGTYTFSDWGAYAANTPTSVSVTQGGPNFAFKEYDTFWYVGDDWKIKSNLTLNLGLTYSYYGQPANLFNQITTTQQKSSTPFWDPTLPLSATTVPTEPSVKDLFGPSVGFAWTPKFWGLGSGKTVIRGGYRLTYDPAFYNTFLLVAASAPRVLAQTFTNPSIGVPADPTGIQVRDAYANQLSYGVFDPRNFDRTTIAPSFGPDRVHEWSLGIQRQVTTNSAFEVRYVGNHGWDLFQSINANPYFAGLAASYPQFVPSGLTPCATPLPTVPSALGRVSCSAGVTDETANSGFSNYNSIQTELRTTALAHQLTLKMGYTFSKTMDNVSEIFSTGLGGNTIAYSQNVLNYKGQEYGLSGLDTPNVWTVAFTEDIPFLRSQQGIVGHILGGWVISGNYIIASGEPYTPSQIELNVLSGGVANDTAFDLANPGTLETSRPFVGSLSAPTQNVGVYAADACAVYNVGCSIAASTLISLNAVNANGSVVNISKNQVHFIANGGEADAIFGTPFGNAGRNSAREYWTNTGNFSLYKNIKFWERVNLQWHMTMVNVFNHPNYTGINPFIENAGNPNFFSGFANPYLQTGSIRTIYFGLKIIF